MKRLLSKKEQERFAWDWYYDPSLALIYKTFSNYVESRVGPYVIDIKSDSSLNTPIGGN